MSLRKTLPSIIMSCLLLFSASACTISGNQAMEGPGENQGGTPNVPDAPDKPDKPDVPDVSGESYEYGELWADSYDGNYTRELLDMGLQEFTYSQLSGEDSYGRKRTPNSGNREGKYVGIFYFLWQNEGNGLYDISKLLEEYGPYDIDHNPLWILENQPGYDKTISPMNAFHYFEEPLYGYYASTDKWVVMKHLELLTYAGIDFLYLDFTNANSGDPKKQPANIYPEATYVLLDSILELQQKGIACPRIVPVVCNPMTGGDQRRANVVQWVYANYYAKDNFKYKSCWFTADGKLNPSGKPLLVTYIEDQGKFRSLFTDPNGYDAFWLRQVVWPTQVTSNSYKNGFPWMDYALPQENYDGFMNVSVAQHTGGSWSSMAFLAQAEKNTGYRYRGRGAVGNEKYAYETDSVDLAILGLNFAEQWKNALEATGEREPSVITVTGWNEWTAQKLSVGNVHADFVDTFSIAFSRDAEMMRDKGGYSDTFYLLLASNTAQFKAKKASSRNSDAAMWKRCTLQIEDLSAWDKVQAKYLDLAGNTLMRKKDSVGHVYHYTDDSARNDIDYLQIANDSENLYVLVRTREDITPYTEDDACWMNLYLATGKRGWQGYDYVINRAPDGKTTSIERLTTDGEGKIVSTALKARADYYVEGNAIVYRIPLAALEIDSGSEIGIKACDNIFGVKRTESNDGVGVYAFGDIEAFYCGGDCAPVGRLNYTYRMAY